MMEEQKEHVYYILRKKIAELMFRNLDSEVEVPNDSWNGLEVVQLWNICNFLKLN